MRHPHCHPSLPFLFALSVPLLFCLLFLIPTQKGKGKKRTSNPTEKEKDYATSTSSKPQEVKRRPFNFDYAPSFSLSFNPLFLIEYPTMISKSPPQTTM